MSAYALRQPPFVWPALLAVVTVPLALVPYGVAQVLWSLVLWMLVTRRFCGVVVALISTASLLSVSWAAIGMDGLTTYPGLLAADVRAFAKGSDSLVAIAKRLGASSSLALILMIVVATIGPAAVLRTSGATDLGWFTAALLFGLLSSPLLWSHYFVLILIPLAIARPRLGAVWLMPFLMFWLSPWYAHPGVWQIGLELLIVTTVAVRAAKPDRRAAIARLGRNVEGC